MRCQELPRHDKRETIMHRLTKTMKRVLLAMITYRMWQSADGKAFLASSDGQRRLFPVSSRTLHAMLEHGYIRQNGPMHLPSCAVDFKLTDMGHYEAADLLGKPI